MGGLLGKEKKLCKAMKVLGLLPGRKIFFEPWTSFIFLRSFRFVNWSASLRCFATSVPPFYPFHVEV